jgi:hypothetical protein
LCRPNLLFFVSPASRAAVLRTTNHKGSFSFSAIFPRLWIAELRARRCRRRHKQQTTRVGALMFAFCQITFSRLFRADYGFAYMALSGRATSTSCSEQDTVAPRACMSPKRENLLVSQYAQEMPSRVTIRPGFACNANDQVTPWCILTLRCHTKRASGLVAMIRQTRLPAVPFLMNWASMDGLGRRERRVVPVCAHVCAG